MSELQLHRFDLSVALFSPSISVPEDKVSWSSQGDGGDGTEGVQLLFIITMLTHVIVTIFVPAGEQSTFSRDTNIKL